MGRPALHPLPEEAECVIRARDVDVADKTGTVLTSAAHLLTTMLGVGAMALPQAMGALGWVAGSIALLFFFAVTQLASYLLLQVAEVDGQQHPRYYEAVGHILGPRLKFWAALAQLTNAWWTCIAYTITAAGCLKTIATISCGLPVGAGVTTDPSVDDTDGCFNEEWAMALLFGLWVAPWVQIPSIQASSVVSFLGALATLLYSFIAVGLCISMMAGGSVYGRAGGIVYTSTANKVFECMAALGTVAFAFGFTYVQLEVQDTIRPPSKAKMALAGNIADVCGMSLYTTVSIVGYAAFGQSVPSMLLSGFSGPRWLLIVANAVVVCDMTSSFNLFSQVVFLGVEEWAAHRLGLHHPAEAAAMGAADAAWAAEELEETAANGGGAEGGPRKLELQPAASLPRAPAFSQAVLRARTLPRGRSLVHGGSLARGTPASGGDALHRSRSTPHGLWRHSAVQQQPGGGEQLVLGPVNEAEEEAEGSRESAQLLRAIASRNARGAVKVRSLAGPLRMQSALRTRRTPELSLPGSKWQWRDARGLSILIRLAYVCATVLLAVFMPFFGSIASLIGSVCYWPLQILLPTLMLLKAYGHELSTLAKRGLFAINAVLALVSLAALVGSVRGIVVGWTAFTLS